MKGFPSRAEVERIKAQYPEGTRICCDYMQGDPNPIPSGTAGKVQYVDDIGTLHCAFDNGRQLGLVPGVDSFHVIQPTVDLQLEEEPDIEESQGMSIDL